LGTGLDIVHPFSDSNGVDHLLTESKQIFSTNSDDVGPKNAARIWGFISKFVMLDRFAKAVGIAEGNGGVLVPRQLCEVGHLGNNGVKVSILYL
jgi:hypothetical protein